MERERAGRGARICPCDTREAWRRLHRGHNGPLKSQASPFSGLDVLSRPFPSAHARLPNILHPNLLSLSPAPQLVDDLLDFRSSSASFGKPSEGADLRLGLATAPVLYAWQELPNAGLGEMVARKFEGEGDVQRVSAAFLFSTPLYIHLTFSSSLARLRPTPGPRNSPALLRPSAHGRPSAAPCPTGTRSAASLAPERGEERARKIDGTGPYEGQVGVWSGSGRGEFLGGWGRKGAMVQYSIEEQCKMEQ